MRAPEQARWDLVQEWLKKADKDLRIAQWLLEPPVEDFENTGFHAQQAAEKFIKAFLVRHQIEFPKTHNLRQLRRLVGSADPALADRLASADELTPYGVTFRYPGVSLSLAREQGEQTVRLAQNVRELVLESLRSYLEAGRP